MGLIEKAKFALNSTDMVVSLIKKWRPKDCKTEKSYEKSLYNYLHNKMEDIQVTKQYAKGRIRADLGVGDKVIIEFKNNLDSTSKYQRLIGQINEYKEWDVSTILILTGKTDKNLRKELDKYLEKEGLNFWDEEITIINK